MLASYKLSSAIILPMRGSTLISGVPCYAAVGSQMMAFQYQYTLSGGQALVSDAAPVIEIDLCVGLRKQFDKTADFREHTIE